MARYTLTMLGTAEPCERCGSIVQAHRRDIDGAVRVSDIRGGQVMPGGHSPGLCTDIRDGRIRPALG